MKDEPIDRLRELRFFFQQRDSPSCFALIADLLASPRCGPVCRLVANCMSGELHRGAEDYDEAEDAYADAVRAGKEVDEDARRGEWYVAYHPRAHLGLITTWRRTLNTNLDEIKELITTTRDKFKNNATTGPFRIPDFPAQIDAVEGVFRRQIGDSGTALRCLTQAVNAVRDLRVDWFVFWHPEHFEAHRVLAYLFTPRRQGESRPLAEKLLRPGVDTWSRSAALAAVLHDELDLFLEKSHPKSPLPEKARSCLDLLAVEGRESLDPTLFTESLMLRAAWSAAAGNAAECLANLARIAGEQNLDENLKFLRGVEAAVVQQNWLAEGDPPAPVRELCQRGAGKLDRLKDGLTAYGYPRKHLDWCRDILAAAGAGGGRRRPVAWGEEPLAMLRARLWP